LEYEHALELLEKKKANIFLLIVAKDSELGGVKCRVKFPSAPQGILKRLDMYKSTGQHSHRDKSKGPAVADTMAKLLGIINTISPEGTPEFAHIDPDDVPARIPDILRKLAEVENKIPSRKKFRRYIKDIAFRESKTAGIILGVFLPILSMLFIMGSKSARQNALKFGIYFGQGLDFLFATIYFLYEAFVPLPTACGDYNVCLSSIVSEGLAGSNSDLWTSCYEGGVECDVLEFIADPTGNCTSCFCNNWLDFCQFLESNKKADLFIGILLIAVCGALVSYAFLILSRTSKKKLKAII